MASPPEPRVTTAEIRIRHAQGVGPSQAGADGDKPPDPDLIRHLVGYEYRSMVIRPVQITVEWQSIEWLDLAGCRTVGTATQQTCLRCPVRAPCLAAAISIDDQAQWRGGVSRDERVTLWQQLETVFLNLRDHDFTRLDRLVDGRSA